MKRIEVLNRIQEIYGKLEKDSLEANEIDELVDLSNNLYERALVLRYKVAEQRIFRDNPDLTTTEIADETDALSEIELTDNKLPETIDFSIFEEKEEQVLEKEEDKNKEEIVVESKQPEKSELNFQDTAERIEPVVEIIAEKEKVEQVVKKEENKPASDDWSSHIEKVLSDHSTGIQKPISSISGSFGLNERILYINELFNGDAEKFSNAVLQFDKTGDWNSCKELISNFASLENWEKKNDTIDEFILHVRRKHA